MNRFLILIFCTLFLSLIPRNVYAFKEDFNFLILDIPFGWEVKEKNEKDFTLENDSGTATFSYKIMPVHHVSVEQFAEAIMRAYGGYSLKLQASGKYYFDFISANKPAWTIVQFHKENALIQTGIGKSEDFSLLIDAGQLK